MNETLYLDVTRLLQAARRRTPTGIERVELAYAVFFGADPRTVFVAGQFGRVHALCGRRTHAFLTALRAQWGAGNSNGQASLMRHAARLYWELLLATGLGVIRRAPAASGLSVYLNLSHENLLRPGGLARFKSRTGAKLICFVHDLIPLTHPEYTRPGEAARHRRRIEAAGEFADAIIANSAATRHELLDFLSGRQRIPAVHALHLGITAAPANARTADATTEKDPYFLFVATIEPRKNHLLLLNIWRELRAEGGGVPRLILVGRRGWENEMVLDMLERCAALAGIVEERAAVSDRELAVLLRGARALLLPSFAEGFGLPVPEALAAGTPVICADLPALREIGLDVPEYLDPLDGPGWRQAILDYAAPESPRRAAQGARLAGWSPPAWDAHFAQARDIIAGLVKPPEHSD